MNTSSAITALALGSLLSLGTAHAASPFDAKPMKSAHKADTKADAKVKEGKCGEGKCGAATKKTIKKADGKCGEGKCGEGKCGEGKCGG